MVWACGGFLSAANKACFNQWWRATFHSSACQYPDKGTVWDYYTKPGTHGFLSWRSSLCSLAPPSDKTAPPFVRTVRAAAMTHLIDLQIGKGYPVLVNGAEGTGKTSLLQQFLHGFCKTCGVEDANLLHVYCNLLMSAGVIWNQILDCLEWDWGKKYTPKGCKKLVCFIDDLHNTEVSCQLAMLGMSRGCPGTPSNLRRCNELGYPSTSNCPQVTSQVPRVWRKSTIIVHYNYKHSPKPRREGGAYT